MKRFAAVLAVLALAQLSLAADNTTITYNGSDAPEYNLSGDVSYPGRTEPYNLSQYTGANLTNNGSGAWLPNINLPNITLPNLTLPNLGGNGTNNTNATKTGVGVIDDTASFLATASPYLLLVIGIVILLLAGFARIIGIVLIVLALLKIVGSLFGWW